MKKLPMMMTSIKILMFCKFLSKVHAFFFYFLWSFHPVKVIFCQKSSGSSAKNLLSFEDSSPTWNEPKTKMDLWTKISKSEDLRSFIATLGQTPSGWLGQLPWPPPMFGQITEFRFFEKINFFDFGGSLKTFLTPKDLIWP